MRIRIAVIIALIALLAISSSVIYAQVTSPIKLQIDGGGEALVLNNDGAIALPVLNASDAQTALSDTSDTTFVFTGSNTDNLYRSEYTIADTSDIPAGASITSVSVFQRFRNNRSDVRVCHFQAGLILGTDREHGTVHTPTDSDWKEETEVIARPGGGSWTSANINDLKLYLEMERPSGGGWCRIVKVDVIIAFTLPSTDANLSTLTVSVGTLDPVFAAATTAYSVSVANSVTTITITATAADTNAVVSGHTGAQTLSSGANTLTVTVTAEDTTTTKDYVITVTRALNADATLSSLSLSGITFSPDFSPSTLTYTASVAHTVSSTTVSATAAVSTSSIISGTGARTLSHGSNTLIVVVQAENGTVIGYSVTVTRAQPPSSDANLASLTVSSGTLSPAFGANVTSYTVSVANSVTSITITAAANHSAATVGGDTGAHSLAVGNTDFTITVTAEDATTKDYTITVTRAQNADATLSTLSLSGLTLSPSFSSSTFIYTSSAGLNVTTTTVSATATQSTSSITSGTGAHSLNHGANTITVVVQAEAGNTQSYVITVTRASPSSDADLATLTVSVGTLSPAFTAATTSYNVSVANSITSITITATVADSTSVISGDTGAQTLVVGTNTFTIIVTAQDASTKSYVVMVTRAQNSDATLSSLSLTIGTLSPDFASGTFTYTASVGFQIGSTIVIAATTQTTSTITSGTGPQNLAYGSNTITVVVQAEAGNTQSYTITITRGDPPSSNADLATLTVSVGTLTPAFSAAETSYSVSVAQSVTSITITATVADATATVGGNLGAQTLEVGQNTFSINVVAEDNSTKTYTVRVFRAAPPSNNADLSDISLSLGILDPEFQPSVTTYQVFVGYTVTSTSVTVRFAHSGATTSLANPYALDIGSNVINIVVTAEDGSTTKSYMLTVVRSDTTERIEEGPPSGPQYKVHVNATIRNTGSNTFTGGPVRFATANDALKQLGYLLPGFSDIDWVSGAGEHGITFIGSHWWTMSDAIGIGGEGGGDLFMGSGEPARNWPWLMTSTDTLTIPDNNAVEFRDTFRLDIDDLSLSRIPEDETTILLKSTAYSLSVLNGNTIKAKGGTSAVIVDQEAHVHPSRDISESGIAHAGCIANVYSCIDETMHNDDTDYFALNDAMDSTWVGFNTDVSQLGIAANAQISAVRMVTRARSTAEDMISNRSQSDKLSPSGGIGGSFANITRQGCSSNLDCIDDGETSDDTGFLRIEATTQATSEVSMEIANFPIDPTSVTSVVVTVRHKRGNTGVSTEIRMRTTHPGEAAIFSDYVASTTSWQDSSFTIPPPTGGWTVAAVNDFRVRIRLRVGQNDIKQLLLSNVLVSVESVATTTTPAQRASLTTSFRIGDDGVETPTQVATFSNTSYRTITQSISKPGGGEWTLDDIAQAQMSFGYSGTVTDNIRVTQSFLRITYRTRTDEIACFIKPHVRYDFQFHRQTGTNTLWQRPGESTGTFQQCGLGSSTSLPPQNSSGVVIQNLIGSFTGLRIHSQGSNPVQYDFTFSEDPAATHVTITPTGNNEATGVWTGTISNAGSLGNAGIASFRWSRPYVNDVLVSLSSPTFLEVDDLTIIQQIGENLPTGQTGIDTTQRDVSPQFPFAALFDQMSAYTGLRSSGIWAMIVYPVSIGVTLGLVKAIPIPLIGIIAGASILVFAMLAGLIPWYAASVGVLVLVGAAYVTKNLGAE